MKKKQKYRRPPTVGELEQSGAVLKNCNKSHKWPIIFGRKAKRRQWAIAGQYSKRGDNSNVQYDQ